MNRKPRADKMIETLTDWATKYDCLNIKELKTLIAIIKKNETAINVSASQKFLNMVKNRQCVKFAGMSEKDFQELMRKQVEEAKQLFDRAKNLSADEVKHIEEVKKRTATARRKNVKGSDIDIDEIMK